MMTDEKIGAGTTIKVFLLPEKEDSQQYWIDDVFLVFNREGEASTMFVLQQYVETEDKYEPVDDVIHFEDGTFTLYWVEDNCEVEVTICQTP